MIRKLNPLCLMAAFLMPTTGYSNDFDYNLLSTFYNHSNNEAEGFNSKLQFDAITVNFSKELTNQLFFNVGAEHGIINQSITEQNIKYDIDMSQNYFFAGLGRYFIHSESLNSYITLYANHYQSSTKITATDTNSLDNEKFTDSYTDTDYSLETGLRLFVSENHKFEVQPFVEYTTGSKDSDPSKSLGVVLSWYTSEKIRLRTGYIKSLENDSDALGLGVTIAMD